MKDEPEHRASASRRPVTPEELGLPAKVGRYECKELIGEGGFGHVLREYDPELRREVAVKVAQSVAHGFPGADGVLSGGGAAPRK